MFATEGGATPVAFNCRSLAVVLGCMFLVACGGGSGGGDGASGGSDVGVGGSGRPPIADLTGSWRVTESGVSNCPGLATYTVPAFEIDIAQNGNTLTVVAPSSTFPGTIDGDTFSWSGSYPSGEGTTTIRSMTLTVASNGNAFSGSATWSWSDGTTSCTGTSQSINATRVPGTGPLPSAPTALSGTPQSPSSIALVWNDNASNETGYKVERRTGSASFAQVALVGANTTTFTDTGLNALTAYEYRVRAYNTAGDSAYSNTATVTTLNAPTPAPQPPSGLSLTVNSSSSITLRWNDNSATEASFHIERSTDANTGFSEIASTGANVTTFENAGLAPATRYYYRVRARNATGNSAYSNTANATTQPAAVAPAAPSNLSATAWLIGTRIELTWRDNSNNETGFKIERSTSQSSGFTQIATTAAGVTGYSDTNGLQRGTRYFYRVRATNSTTNLDSAYSNVDDARTAD